MKGQELPRKAIRTVACRECQRLKLKCNKSWPCEPCLKRGVAEICPDGVLPPAKQQRSHLIDASRLHERTAQMADRIRQLEDALATVQSIISPEPHPLLADELRSLSNPLKQPPSTEGIPNANPVSSLEEAIESFGTLSIGVNGRTIFHSQTVSADYLVEPPWNTNILVRDRSIAEAKSLPSGIICLGTLFPFGDAKAPLDNLKHEIISFLPVVERTRYLVENYYNHFSWWFNPIPREQFEHEVYPIISTPTECILAHRLSALFMMLAISTILDLEGDLDSTGADSFWQLSRAAFCLEPLLDVSSTYTIQALQLMVAYLYITNRQKLEHQWVILGLIARLIHSVDFDAVHWIKDPQIVERRRRVFYDALSFDTFLSFTMGRPPAYALAHIQCRLPADDEKIVELDKLEQCGFPNWQYRFTKECLLPLMDEAFGAIPPSYNTILRLDRKLREFPVPHHLVYTGLVGDSEESDADQMSLHTCLQRAFVLLSKEASLINLHRIYYARALYNNPENPLAGKYATSVLATFRSASRIIDGCEEVSSRYLTLVSRNWWLWQKATSAGIVLAMLVSRSPKCKLAQSALVKLRQTTDLLHCRTSACRSADSRCLMETLRRQAEEDYCKGEPALTSSEPRVLDDEYAIFPAVASTIPREEHQNSTDAPQVEQPNEQQVEQDIEHDPHAHADLMQFWDKAWIVGNSIPESTVSHEGFQWFDPTLAPSMSISDPNTFLSSGDYEAHWQNMPVS